MLEKENLSSAEQIEALLKTYFDGLYFNDLSLLKQVFHPKARYTCANNDAFLTINMEEYYEILKHRTAPASLKHKRKDKILWVDINAPYSAMAKVECVIEPKFFTDYLCLVRSDKGWQIISKTFSYILTTH